MACGASWTPPPNWQVNVRHETVSIRVCFYTYMFSDAGVVRAEDLTKWVEIGMTVKVYGTDGALNFLWVLDGCGQSYVCATMVLVFDICWI